MRIICFAVVPIVGIFLIACSGPKYNVNNTNNATVVNSTSTSEAQNLTVIERPQKIKDMMASRGQQDDAKPTLKIIEPKGGATIPTSTVKVKLALSGDLRGYKPMMDEATHTGNHIHVILDNQPYEAYYNLDQPFELRNVADGDHTLRVFPSRPWHESYKSEGAFQMVKFTVKNGGADETKPTTTNAGQPMSNGNVNAATKPTPEGKDMQNIIGGSVDPKKPLLTYSRPKGEYKGTDADAIMIDFWLTNVAMGGQQHADKQYIYPSECNPCRVRYTIDGGEPKYIDEWAPIWLSGWTAGKHTVKLELVNQKGEAVDNGGYNSTSREITITK